MAIKEDRQDRFFETLRLNWPRYTDGDLVQTGDVVDIQRIGTLKVSDIRVSYGTSFALNGFWVGGLEIRKHREVA